MIRINTREINIIFFIFFFLKECFCYSICFDSVFHYAEFLLVTMFGVVRAAFYSGLEIFSSTFISE